MDPPMQDTIIDGTSMAIVMTSIGTTLLFVYTVFCLWTQWPQFTGAFKIFSLLLLFILPGIGPLIILFLLYFGVGTRIGIDVPIEVQPIHSRTDIASRDPGGDYGVV
jgi:hypothetical protein